MTYDLLILGGGPAGFRAAERAGHFGLNTAIFEGKTLGGVCLNEGCIPTKTMLYSAKLYDYAKGGAAKYKKSGGLGVTCLVFDQDIFLSNTTSGNMVAYKDMIMQWNEAKDYLYPVPITDRTMTSGALSQNPGWNDGLQY